MRLKIHQAANSHYTYFFAGSGQTGTSGELSQVERKCLAV